MNNCVNDTGSCEPLVFFELILARTLKGPIKAVFQNLTVFFLIFHSNLVHFLGGGGGTKLPSVWVVDGP